MTSTDKKIVLITGSNSGIGLELASQLLDHADYHVLAGVRSQEKADQTSKTLKGLGKPGSFETILVDVSSDESIDKAVSEIQSKHARVDAVVNNAGISMPSSPLSMREQLQQCFNTNAAGPFILVSKLEPLLRKSSTTVRIVNVSSGAGSIAMRLNKDSPMYKMPATQYRTSKTALNMITADLHAFHEDDGWKVFAYCPGFCVSNLSEMNSAESGAKSAAEGAKPIVDLLQGKRDKEAGTFVHENGTYSW